jgi:hypothetical protein
MAREMLENAAIDDVLKDQIARDWLENSRRAVVIVSV